MPTPTATDVPIPGNTDKVAFVTGEEIWIMNPDGSGITPVTRDGAPKSHLQWLPDGKSILYLSRECAYTVDTETDQTETIACFRGSAVDGFRVSPDGENVAISLNLELIIVPFDQAGLSGAQDKTDLLALENSCLYSGVSTKDIRWSNDGERMAVVYIDTTGSRFVDKVRVLDVSNCATGGGIFALDQFPLGSFTLSGYQNEPIIPSIDWDGEQRFLLNDVVRNDGFGNLYLYDMNTKQGELFNPIDGTCCYRDARWSPDGKYVAFLYQDIRQAAQSANKFYFVSFEDLQTGQVGDPFRLPIQVFASPREQPQPAFRPVQ